jgi:hypothetical protein
MECGHQEKQYRFGISFNLQTGSIMDPGIQGKKALLAASTSGLGLACATALARESCLVYINGRDAERLEKAQQHISQATGAKAIQFQVDINTPAGGGIIDRLDSALAQVSKKSEITNYRSGLKVNLQTAHLMNFLHFWKQSKRNGMNFLVF